MTAVDLLRASTTIGEHYYAAAATVGLTVQEAQLLFILSSRPTNMLGLKSALDIPKSTMTGLMARMESAGLVQRETTPSDRRQLVATPTERGRAVASAFAGDLSARVSGTLVGLSATERDELAELVSGILATAERLDRSSS